ncbi:SKAP protein, partial [Grallaria varia]|nr:SKAP protein [Grallaria varia]
RPTAAARAVRAAVRRAAVAIMNGDASRIPVCGGTHRRAPPAETQETVPSKKQHTTKTADPGLSKDPNLNFGSNIPADGIVKAGNQGCPKSTKKVERFSRNTVTKGPLKRQKLEAEVKTKNQLLETANQHLHSRLTEAQSTVEELKKENDSLVQEVEKLKKFQKTCMVILESRNIDPVTGSNILEQEEVTQECQKQSTVRKLIEELRLFNQTCAKEKEKLQAVKEKWNSAEESQQTLETYSSFQAELKEYMATLDELERLL